LDESCTMKTRSRWADSNKVCKSSKAFADNQQLRILDHENYISVQQTTTALALLTVASVRPLKPELMINISAHFFSTKTIAIICSIAALAVTLGDKAYAATID
jgi:hypothetical protein